MSVAVNKAFFVYGTFFAIVSLFSLVQFSDCKFIPIFRHSRRAIPVALVPENRTLTRMIEVQLGQNDKSSSWCSTEDDGPPMTSTRNGIIGSRYRWTNFNVYPDPAYNANERVLINNAMVRLSAVLPCVRFTLWSGSPPSGDYVYITKGSGCSSYVGRRGGAQSMSLQSPGCMSIGTIMHEMIHALGSTTSRPVPTEMIT